MFRVVAYYRVSTEAQGRSGLGLAAQREAVTSLCATRGWSIIADFTEVESGKRDSRVELGAALHHAKVTGAGMTGPPFGSPSLPRMVPNHTRRYPFKTQGFAGDNFPQLGPSHLRWLFSG